MNSTIDTPPSVARYLEIRKAARDMFPRIMRATQNRGFNSVHAAKSMGIRVAGRTLIFDDESQMAAFTDFSFHEYLVEGKNQMQACDPVAAGFSPIETEILAAFCKAETSLFQLAGTMPESSQVRLRDLLNPEREEVKLIDTQFSQSAFNAVDLLIFLRVVQVQNISMSSGFFFPFEPHHGPGLLQAYRQKMKKVPPAALSRERFAFFHRKFRQIGGGAALHDPFAPSEAPAFAR